MCDSVAYASADVEPGPLGMDYMAFYYCSLDANFGAMLLLLDCASFLIYLLGNTASNYFSSTLASICEKMKLSYEIAGVTFLAFGNGAPDVFSSFASIGGGANPMIGLGSVLGGSVFVTTIVVGAVAVNCPCQLEAASFLRDILFYIVVAALLTFISLTGRVTMGLSFGLLGTYVAYAITVSVSSCYQNKKKQEREALKAGKPVPTAIQTAYWYKSDNKQTTSASKSSSGGFNVSKGVGLVGLAGKKNPIRKAKNGYSYLESQDVDELETDVEDANDEDDEETTYKFLILDESIDKRKSTPGQEEDDASVINISGGFLAGEFTSLIIEDYFDPVRGKFGMSNVLLSHSKPMFTPSPSLSSSSSTPPISGVNRSMEPFNFGDDSLSPLSSGDSLTASLLLSSENIDFSDDGSGSSNGANRNGSSSSQYIKPKMLQKKSLATRFYWQQKLLHKRLERRFLSAEWWTQPWYFKILAVIEFPFVLARDVTIPTIDEALWYRPLAVVHPFCGLMFLLLVTGQFYDKVGFMPAWTMTALIGAFFVIVMFFTTHNSYPPKNYFFSTVWGVFSFVMCCTWIYALAGELVSCLTAVGTIIGVPPIYMGLTVLAWGNSIGDLFSNISIARKDLGELAMSGCYAGPIFDILLGLGIALLTACSRSYPQPFTLATDEFSLVSCVFLFIALIATGIVVTFQGFRLERWFGFCLFGLYGLHLLVQFILLVA
jgi:Ca2+/Na+ antiporter